MLVTVVKGEGRGDSGVSDQGGSWGQGIHGPRCGQDVSSGGGQGLDGTTQTGFATL